MAGDDLLITPERVRWRGFLISWDVAPHDVKRIRAGVDAHGFDTLAIVGRGLALVRILREQLAQQPELREPLLAFVDRVPERLVTARAADLLRVVEEWGDRVVPPAPVTLRPFW